MTQQLMPRRWCGVPRQHRVGATWVPRQQRGHAAPPRSSSKSKSVASGTPSQGVDAGLNVLVVGGGGREHALTWRISQSPRCDRVFCIPGNAGTAKENKVGNKVEEDKRVNPAEHDSVASFCARHAIGLVVIGPEAELVTGLADHLRARGVRTFGPSAAAAQLEGSKTFMKKICARCGIPCPHSETFSDAESAKRFLRRPGGMSWGGATSASPSAKAPSRTPIVVKADGLAAGKGVIIAETVEEAEKAIDAIHAQFGNEQKILIEEFLQGEEASYFALVDSEGHVASLASAQDHKRVGEGDRGENTGGMGAYSPAPVVDDKVEQKVMDRIIRPVVRGLEAEGCPFQGVIFAGLMIDPVSGDPKVLEFNVRFGDPECEVLMYRLKSDALDLLVATCDGNLEDTVGDRVEGEQVHRVRPEWSDEAALAVIMAAKGYPGSYAKGTVIDGITSAEEGGRAKVFHAGTATRDGTGEVLANGGRVLAVTSSGASVKEAQAKAYEAVDRITWDGGFCRRDIGWRALQREGEKR